MTDPYRELRSFSVKKGPEPQHVGRVISEFVALKGLARVHGLEQLHQAWRTVVGTDIGQRSRVLQLNRGILNVGVASGALLNELSSFHKQQCLEQLQQKFSHLKIRDIKFKLKTDLK